NASTVSGPTTGNNPVVTFGAPTSGTSSTWTINVTATMELISAGGTRVTKTASATPVTVTVTNLANGIYISQVKNDLFGNTAFADANGVLNVGNHPRDVDFTGLVVGAAGTLNTTFTAAFCSLNYDPVCANPGTPVSLTTTNASTTSPTAV